MRVVIAGGHGQVALRLGRLLAARGDTVRGLIRNPEHAGELTSIGVEAVVCDIEHDEDISAAVGDADAVVFAAGAGPGSGDARKQTVDLGGAVKLIDAAHTNGIRRYLMVSAMGAARPDAAGEGMSAYMRAKATADERLAASGLDFTIVRPGALTDDPGSGLIDAAEEVARAAISRDDVAATLMAALEIDHTIGRTFECVAGSTPIDEALAAL